MKHRLFTLILSILLILSLFCSCTSSNETNTTQNTSTGASGAAEGNDTASDSLTLTDMAGREITINGEINRIVVIGSALRLYCYINGTDKLIGVEKAQQTANRPYIMANPKLAELTVIGEGHPSDPDPELLLQANPDVIIAGDIMDQSSIEELQAKIGIPIVIVSCGDSVLFDSDMYTAMGIVGEITGRQDRAQDLIDYMESCKTELNGLTENIPDLEKPTVYVGGLSYKGTHGIDSTTTNSPLLTVLNAKNVADTMDVVGSVMIDKEQLLIWDPDVLILDENGLGLIKDDYNENTDFYTTLAAVQNQKIYGQLPYVSYYNNIETALADVYYVGKILYPDYFSAIDPETKADEIYEFFLGAPLYEKMAQLYGGFTQISLTE